jgi:hypothetical protein
MCNPAARKGTLQIAARAVSYPMKKIREYFAYRNALTKYEIALHIAKIIPAFSYQIPPKPTIWRSEDARQGLYDAAAVGLVFFSPEDAHRLPEPGPDVV